MRLRQKLFLAILAAMAVMFLLLALVFFMNALEAEGMEIELRERLRRAAVARFREAAMGDDPGRWDRLAAEMASLGHGEAWAVLEGAATVAGGGEGTLREAASEGGARLLLGPRAGGLRPVERLSGVFWAVAAGTVFLMLIVYGLLLRLVLRPVEDLVAASRSLSSGARPPRVSGESRTDEVGELVRSFNRMASEVVSSREELERRVELAVADYERAQRRLVLEQRLSATGKLAAGVAHEIANPLGGMVNAARAIAKEEGLSERGREYVGLVGDGLARIDRIVERMRSFVRRRPEVGPVGLSSALDGALAFAEHRIEKEGVSLSRDAREEELTASGDRGELEQVILNLLVNALDAMREVEPKRISVSVRRDGEWGIVEVADTGPGMAPEQLAGAFDLFYSTKGEGGTGLGLAIAHRIVTDHGGELELESSPGKGTVARVRLPVERERPEPGTGAE